MENQIVLFAEQFASVLDDNSLVGGVHALAGQVVGRCVCHIVADQLVYALIDIDGDGIELIGFLEDDEDAGGFDLVGGDKVDLELVEKYIEENCREEGEKNV